MTPKTPVSKTDFSPDEICPVTPGAPGGTTPRAPPSGQPPQTPTRPKNSQSQSQHGHVNAVPPSANAIVHGRNTQLQPPPSQGSSHLRTPSNFGTSYTSTARSENVTAEVIEPFIKTDIAMPDHRLQIDFEKLLKVFVKRCAPAPIDDNNTSEVLLNNVLQECTKFCNESGIVKDVERDIAAYGQARTSEKRGYDPLVNYVNTILKKLEEQPGNTFAGLKNLSQLKPRMIKLDPRQIQHLYNTAIYHGRSQRSPDLVFVSKHLLDKIPKLSAHTFEWTEIITTWEVKLASHTGIPGLPEKFVEGSKVTKYRCLPDGPTSITGIRLQRLGTRVYEVGFKEKYNRPAEPSTSAQSDHVSQPAESAAPSTTSNSFSIRTRSISGAAGSSKRRHDEISNSNDSEEEDNSDRDLDDIDEEDDGDDGDDYMEKQPKSKKSKKLKETQNTKKREPHIQNAVYGTEMLCRNIWTLHSINILVVDDVLWVWWFDRQNALQSTGLNFIRDMPYFVALLVAFQRFDLLNWGIEPDLAPSGIIVKKNSELSPGKMLVVDFDGIIVTTKNRSKLSFGGPVMKGRATCIVPAASASLDPVTKKPLTGEDLVIKACWPEQTRLNEADIIREAQSRVPVSLEIDMKSNLPRLIAWKDISHSSTGIILSEVELSAAPKDPEPRILRLLLFTELVPLDKLSSMDDIIKAWVDCFKCHYALWGKGVEHGDISVWNLMWDPKNNCGILNDWDLSFVADGIKKGGDKIVGRSGERTGTVPFMARGLLQDIVKNKYNPRVYRHEVESFIWVFTWMCIKESQPEMLTVWRKGSHDTVRRDKTILLYDDYLTLEVTSPGWEKCTLLLELLLAVDQFLKVKKEGPNNQLLMEAVVKIMEGEITEPNFVL